MCYDMFMAQENTITDMIMAMLMSGRSTRVYRKILWERLQERKKYSRQTYNQALYRLDKSGHIILNKEDIELIKKYSAKKASEWIVRTKKPLNIGKVLVAFDIPETKRKDRNWLRRQLKDWDFKMVQQSLWLGNGPLPAEFYSHINLLGIKNNIKVFKVSKKQT